MVSSVTVIDGSGAGTTINGSALHAVDGAREVRVAAPNEQLSVCSKGNDLLLNMEDGQTVRLINYFQEDPAAMPTLILKSATGGYLPFTPAQVSAACQGTVSPVPGQNASTINETMRPVNSVLGALGSVGAAQLIEEDEHRQPLSFDAAKALGAVTEISDGASGENSRSLKAEGEIPFFGDDQKSVHKAIARLVSAEDSAHGSVAGHGTFTPVIDKNSGSSVISWTFEVEDAAIDYLAAGQTIRQTYEVSIDDGKGGTATKNVTITLTGTNDAPVITGGETTAPAEDEGTVHRAAGEVQFQDVDLIDTHVVAFRLVSPEADAERGAFTSVLIEDSTGSGAGRIEWQFEASDTDIGDLAEGEIIEQVYEITVRDGNGGKATKLITVTITGKNDAPTITGGATAGQIDELPDGHDEENLSTLTTGGTIDFGDVDLTDTHEASSTLVSSNDSLNGSFIPFGTFVASIVQDSTGTGSGRLNWRFEVNDGDLAPLAAGQIITQVYRVTISDGKGETTTQDVTVVIRGTNDAPIVQSVDETVDEDGAPITITSIFADIDAADTHTFSIDTTNTKGTVVKNGDGTFTYDPGGAFDDLGAGETATDTFTYTVRDSAGAEATETVTVRIIGKDGADAAPPVEEISGSMTSEFTLDPASDFVAWTVDGRDSPFAFATASTTAESDDVSLLLDAVEEMFFDEDRVSYASEASLIETARLNVATAAATRDTLAVDEMIIT